MDESKRCGQTAKAAAQAKKGGEAGRPRQRNWVVRKSFLKMGRRKGRAQQAGELYVQWNRGKKGHGPTCVRNPDQAGRKDLLSRVVEEIVR